MRSLSARSFKVRHVMREGLELKEMFVPDTSLISECVHRFESRIWQTS